MTQSQILAFIGCVIVSLACSSGGPNVSSPLVCTGSERSFNGACRERCSTTQDCAPKEQCADIGDDQLCMPFGTCGYLSSETQCVVPSGGTYSYSRSGGAHWVNYTGTLNADPNKSTGLSDHHPVGNVNRGPCVGDGHWVSLPANGPVACNSTHDVSRCFFTGTSCELVYSQTRESFEP